MEEKNRNLGPLLIILIALLVAVGGYLSREGRWGEMLSKFGLSLGSGLELVEGVQQGEVINGFPVDLLGIVQDAEVLESGRYKDKKGNEVMKTTYSTRAAISDIFAGYVNYLSEHGYEIISADARSGVAAISATGGGFDLSMKASIEGAHTNEVEIVTRVSVIE